MIIGVVETEEVRLYASISEAMEEWGSYPTDIASDVVVFYDEDGTWLKPVMKYARRWYQLKPRVVSVELRRATADEYEDPLGYKLQYEVSRLAPNALVSSLEQLRALYPHKDGSSCRT